MDIAPVHTVFSQVVIPAVADGDVLTDGDCIEVFYFQEHMVAVEADGMTLVVRGLFCTHDTFVTCIGVGHGKLGTV